MESKSAFIAVVGRPNVGKSSFINRAVGSKVAIVSDKPQTTRTRIMGVLTCGASQLVFVDTPGFHKPRNVLGERMVKAAQTGLSDVDAALLVVDAAPEFRFNPESLPAAETALIEQIAKRKIPAVLALNKIDKLADKSGLLSMIKAYSDYFKFDAVYPILVMNGDGVEELKTELLSFCKPSPHFFPDDVNTDQPEKTMVAELIREKILRLYDKEIPHGTAVEIERFFERDNKNGEPVLVVEAVIYCEKESHKGIIIGKNGSALKKVGMLARRDIEEFFGINVSLQLWVKVKEDWRNRGGIIHTLGLD